MQLIVSMLLTAQEDFVIQCRMSNKPYDFFGTWYNDNYLLSGDLRWLAHLVSTSVVWLNRASQESDSEFTSIMNRMFKFYNRSASSIRSITVANCRSLPQRQATSSSPTPSGTSDDCSSNKVLLIDCVAIPFKKTNLCWFTELSRNGESNFTAGPSKS